MHSRWPIAMPRQKLRDLHTTHKNLQQQNLKNAKVINNIEANDDERMTNDEKTTSSNLNYLTKTENQNTHL